MKKIVCSLLFLFCNYFIFSQEVDVIKYIAYIAYEYEYLISDSYGKDNVFNNLSYDMKYSGDNIEDGIKHFVENNPFIFKTDVNNRGILEKQRETAGYIKNQWDIINETNFNIAYLILGWRILDIYEFSKKSTARIFGNEIDPQLSYQINSLKRDIEFRANIISLNYTNGRQLLSLFDIRTWTKLGFI